MEHLQCAHGQRLCVYVPRQCNVYIYIICSLYSGSCSIIWDSLIPVCNYLCLLKDLCQCACVCLQCVYLDLSSSWLKVCICSSTATSYSSLLTSFHRSAYLLRCHFIFEGLNDCLSLINLKAVYTSAVVFDCTHVLMRAAPQLIKLNYT